MTGTLLRATTELVTQAWVKTVVGDIVATKLPRDNTSWSKYGFVTLATTGGNTGLYVPMRSPVVSLDCWGVHPESGRPAWNRATALAERIVAATYDPAYTPQLVTLPAGYAQARVLTVYPAYEPRRVPDDPGSYARISLGLTVNWVEVPS